MSSDLNAALANLRDADPSDRDDHGIALAALRALLAVPEGAVLVTLTRDDLMQTATGPLLLGAADYRVAAEAWNALDALEAS